MLCSLLCILCILVRTTSADSLDAFLSTSHDAPFMVREGPGSVTLPCVIKQKYFDRGKYDLNWAQYNNGNLRIITKNDKVLLRKNVTFGLTNDPGSGNYSLTITGIEKSQIEGSYHCNVVAIDDDDVQFSSIANVIVLVPPSNPTINIEPSGSIQEGEFVTATCSSFGGSPRPIFEWKLPNNNGSRMSMVSTVSESSLTKSIIHYQIKSEDNQKYIECKVRNAAMPELETKDVISEEIDVHFKPIVSISPNENSTHLTVEENTLVNLTCSGISNPPIHSYEWEQFQLMEMYHGKNFQFKANSSMSGSIKCTAINDIGKQSALLELVVQYGPKVSVPKSYDPNEMEDVNIMCSVDSNPLATDIKWIGPNNFKQNGSVLILNSITSSQTGNYTCIATNFLSLYGFSGSQQRIGSATVYVNVKRKPGFVHIEPIENVDIGDTIHLFCKVNDVGNPPASYLWATPASGNSFGSDGHNMPNFTIQNAQLSDNGVYSCKTFNNVGEGGTASTKVTVIEKAKISSSLATENIFTAGQQNISLECEAQGYPLPTITWLKYGNMIEEGDFNIKSISSSKCENEDLCTYTVTSTLFLNRSLTWLDKGNFTCITDNGSHKTYKGKSSWTILRVLHKPVIVKDYSSGKTLVAAEVGSHANLECVASGRPTPEIIWTFKDKIIAENHKYSLRTTSVAEKPDEYIQTLRIENIQHSDYGDYICRAINSNGEDSMIVELKTTSLPACPEHLTKESASMDSLSLSWAPQFDGGLEQSFVIELSKLDPFTGKFGDETTTYNHLVDKAHLQDYKTFEINGIVRSLLKYNLTGLTPLSTYLIRLKAKNEKGDSNFTPSIVATTDDVLEDSNIMSPKHLNFDLHSYAFNVEPKLPDDACIIFYVLTDGVWRSTHCHKSTDIVPQMFNGKKFKARFCTTTPIFKCSRISNESWSKTTSSWKLNYIISMAFFIFFVAISIMLCRACYRVQNNSKPLELLPVIVSTSQDHGTENLHNKIEHLNFHHINENSSSNMNFIKSNNCDTDFFHKGNDSEKNEDINDDAGSNQENRESDDDQRVVKEIIV